MAKYAVKVRGRKSPFLITAKNAKDARRWVKKMGFIATKAEKLYTFTK